MGNTAVFVFVASSLANVLKKGGSVHWTCWCSEWVFTDFVTGAFGINEGWKLKTPLESSTISVLP